MRRSQNSYKTPSKSLVATKSSKALFIACFDRKLGGGFKDFHFHPYLGTWSNSTNISQMVDTVSCREPPIKWPQKSLPCSPWNGNPDFSRHYGLYQYILINAQESLKAVRLYVYQFDRLLGWSAENHPPKNNLTFFRHLGVHEISRNSPEMSALLKKTEWIHPPLSQDCSNLGHIFSYWILMKYPQYFVRVSTSDWKFRIHPL